MLFNLPKGKTYTPLLFSGVLLSLLLNYDRLRNVALSGLNFERKFLLLPLAFLISFFVIFITRNCLRRKTILPLLTAMLTGLFLFNFLQFAYLLPRYDLFKVALGKESREEFLLRVSEATSHPYRAFQFINETLPLSAKIFLIGENQSYYLKREFVAHSPLDTNMVVELVDASSGTEEFTDKLKELDITHIFYNASEAKRIDLNYSSFNWKHEGDKEKFFFFLGDTRFLKMIFSNEGIFIYQLL